MEYELHLINGDIVCGNEYIETPLEMKQWTEIKLAQDNFIVEIGGLIKVIPTRNILFVNISKKKQTGVRVVEHIIV